MEQYKNIIDAPSRRRAELLGTGPLPFLRGLAPAASLAVGVLIVVEGVASFGADVFGLIVLAFMAGGFICWVLGLIPESIERSVIESARPELDNLEREAQESALCLQQLQNQIDQEFHFERERIWKCYPTYPPDWEIRRGGVLARDGHTCKECGWPSGALRKTRELHVHHVVSISQGGDHSIENLITLCDICHRSVDGRHANVRKLRRASRRRRC